VVHDKINQYTVSKILTVYIKCIELAFTVVSEVALQMFTVCQLPNPGIVKFQIDNTLHVHLSVPVRLLFKKNNKAQSLKPFRFWDAVLCKNSGLNFLYSLGGCIHLTYSELPDVPRSFHAHG